MNYQGAVQFISNTKKFAVVKESPVIRNIQYTGRLVDKTGTAEDLLLTANLFPFIQEGSLSVVFGTSSGGVTGTVGKDYPIGTTAGRAAITSTGGVTITSGVVHTAVGDFGPEYGCILGSGISININNYFSYINYETGKLVINAKQALAAISDIPVYITYKRKIKAPQQEIVKYIVGDFSDVRIDDIIYYDYVSSYVDTPKEVTLYRSTQ